MDCSCSEILNERKKRVLSFINSSDYIPLKFDEISIMLDVPIKERYLLLEILEQLEQEGEIIRSKRGKYMPCEMLNIVRGIFLSNTKGSGVVCPSEAGMNNIFINTNSLNHALHKDTVLCRIISKEPEKNLLCGEIIKILKHGYVELVGTFKRIKKSGFVIPDDKKVATDIFIPFGDNKGAVSGNKVIVRIVKWSVASNSPEGVITKILGHVNDPGIEILSIIHQFKLPLDFGQDVYTEISNIPDELSSSDYFGRLDLRTEQTVTIDGADAKDLDDAISISKNDDGSFILGVHIADVSHYVKEDTVLDAEALKRGTSTYLVDRVIPMLPHKLSNGICSLHEGVDRLTLSCIMTIDKSGNIISHKIRESVINSDKKMTYDILNSILSEENANLIESHKEFMPMFKNMQHLASILREKRFKRGAIDFDIKECKIILNNEGDVVDIAPNDRNTATNIIEEFMLACNETIAEDYFWQDIPFVFRTHEKPDPEKIINLSKIIRNFGYRIKGSNALHPKELQKILDDVKGKPEEHIVTRMVLRSMKQARYSNESRGHFGLSTKYYCHFTSPIRRYPDLQIHRIIKENIKSGISDKKNHALKIKLPEICTHCSNRERISEECERETEKIKKVQFMVDKIGLSFSGIISSITNWGIYVELPNTIEGLISYKSMDDYFVFDEEGMLCMGEVTGKTYRLGEHINIQVIGANVEQKTIDFAILEY